MTNQSTLSPIEAAVVILQVARSRRLPADAILKRLSPAFSDLALVARQDGSSGIEYGLQRHPDLREAFDEAGSLRLADVAPPDEQALPGPFAASDLGNSERLVALHGHDLRYCHDLGGWFHWDGRRWTRDRTGQAIRFAKSAIRSMGAEADRLPDPDRKIALKWAIESESRRHLDASLYLAQSDPRVVVTPDKFNADPWSLNALNGTVDLRSGILRPHDRADLITKLAPVDYDPAASCPRWEKALSEIFAGDGPMVDYVARAVGYAASGDISVQEFFILHGDGANGKNILIDLILFVLGEYGRQAEPSLLLAKQNDDHPTGVAALDGARFVAASETDSGRKLNEALIKRLTGDEKISARFMHKDFYEFTRTFKVFLATNHRPKIAGKDRGIWRRVRLIPFGVTFVKADEAACPPFKLPENPALKAALLMEASGILAWIVRGFQDWRQGGMRPPRAVLEATENYRADMDSMASFVGQCCRESPFSQTKTSTLYSRYKIYCEQSGLKDDDVLTETAFARDLERRGYKVKHTKVGNLRLGIELRTEQAEFFADPAR